MGKIAELDDNTISKTLEGSQVPVLIDFYATWCGPCKMLAPTIEAVSGEYAGKLQVFKIDIEKAPNATNHFGISSVPTVIFFKQGKEVDRMLGNQDMRAIQDRVKKLIA